MEHHLSIEEKQLAQQATKEFYEAHAQSVVDKTKDLDLSCIYRLFLELLPETAHILDAGCGSGRDSLFFLKCGFSVTAFDFSP